MTEKFQDLSIDYEFKNEERDEIISHLEEIKVNPYKHYPSFRRVVLNETISLAPIRRFIKFLERRNSTSNFANPFVFIRNSPIDRTLPIFSNDNPVHEKYQKKKTYVTEGFLQIYAELTGQHIISYMNVNDGDAFHDIFPSTEMAESQSQKAFGPIYFHGDLSNHFVRPDVVNIVSLRSSIQNEIYTTFVSNKEIFEILSEETKKILSEKIFLTPYGDLNSRKSKVLLGSAPKHSIITNGINICLAENRTFSDEQRGQDALAELLKAAHMKKKKLLMMPGDFVSIHNNLSLHGKEIGVVSDIEQQWLRWSMKTINVYSISPHLKYIEPGSDYLVHG
ncbi:hypothetical protein [Azospirillum humicireducens]|uniref:hypothetical protein n=1 Tax=Azospirillum humicireducens TaxID=1226968 RepID=UPI0011B1FD50|nr:hypothetical protein [Azospirillum humicireducens]